MIVMKVKKIWMFLVMPLVAAPFVWFVNTYYMESYSVIYAILILVVVSVVNTMRNCDYIISEDGFTRKTTVYFLFFTVFERNKVVPWRDVRNFIYKPPLRRYDPFNLSGSFELDTRNNGNFFINNAFTHYKEAVAYIVEKLKNKCRLYDEDTRYKLDKMGIWDMKESDKKEFKRVRFYVYLLLMAFTVVMIATIVIDPSFARVWIIGYCIVLAICLIYLLREGK